MHQFASECSNISCLIIIWHFTKCTMWKLYECHWGLWRTRSPGTLCESPENITRQNRSLIFWYVVLKMLNFQLFVKNTHIVFCLNHNIFNTQWLSVSPYYFTSKKGETKNTSFFIVNISWKIKDSKAHLSVRQTVLDAIASHFLPDRQMQARSGEFLFRKKRAEERSRPFGSGGFFSPHQNAASFFWEGYP